MLAYTVQYRVRVAATKKAALYHDGTLKVYPGSREAALHDTTGRRIELIPDIDAAAMVPAAEVESRVHLILVDAPQNAAAVQASMAAAHDARLLRTALALTRPAPAPPRGTPPVLFNPPSSQVAPAVRRVGLARPLSISSASPGALLQPPAKRPRVSATPSTPAAALMASPCDTVAGRWSVQWTDQLRKKHKMFNDGECLLYGNNKMVLKDESGKAIASMFVRNMPTIGDDVQFDYHLVQIDEELGLNGRPLASGAVIADNVLADSPATPMAATGMVPGHQHQRLATPFRSPLPPTSSHGTMPQTPTASASALHRFVSARSVPTTPASSPLALSAPAPETPAADAMPPPPPPPALRTGLVASTTKKNPIGLTPTSLAQLRFKAPRTRPLRMQRVPDTFATPDDYARTWSAALVEHVQCMVSAVAIDYTTAVAAAARRARVPRPASLDPESVVAAARAAGVNAHSRVRISRTTFGSWALEISDSPPPSGGYSKDEMWVVAESAGFERPAFVMSTFYGSARGVEFQPISKFTPTESATTTYYAIRLFACHERAVMATMDTALEHMPLLPYLLDYRSATATPSSVTSVHGAYFAAIPAAEYSRVVDATVSEHALNAAQAAVLRDVANKWRTRPASITLVQGVFGSGKSHLIAVMAILFARAAARTGGSYQQRDGDDRAAADAETRMLLSSNTNVAVDRVLENLLEKGFTQFVRIGNKKRVAKGILPHTTAPTASISGGSSGSGKRNSGGGAKSASDQSQAQDLPTLSTSRIVGATCLATLGDALDHERFGVVILDECSQLTEPLSLLPQRFGVRHLICVGDPRQLPPTLESDPSHPDHLEKTLFERLERAGCPVAVLDAQYRCHPSISRISNTLFYDSRLVDGDPDGATSRVAVPGLPPVAIIDTAAAGNGAAATEAYVPRARTYINVAEANEVVRAYHVLTRGLGVRPGDIGIIALYRGQADRIRSMLAAASVPTSQGGALTEDLHDNSNEDTTNVTVVSTVDAFQGQEKSIVLVSTVRTAKLGTFAADARRLNVMLTRARAHLLVFGHARLLATAEIWRRITGLAQMAVDARAFRGTMDALAAAAGLKGSGEFAPPPLMPPMTPLVARPVGHDAMHDLGQWGDTGPLPPPPPPLPPIPPSHRPVDHEEEEGGHRVSFGDEDGPRDSYGDEHHRRHSFGHDDMHPAAGPSGGTVGPGNDLGGGEGGNDDDEDWWSTLDAAAPPPPLVARSVTGPVDGSTARPITDEVDADPKEENDDDDALWDEVLLGGGGGGGDAAAEREEAPPPTATEPARTSAASATGLSADMLAMFADDAEWE